MSKMPRALNEKLLARFVAYISDPSRRLTTGEVRDLKRARSHLAFMLEVMNRHNVSTSADLPESARNEVLEHLKRVYPEAYNRFLKMMGAPN